MEAERSMRDQIVCLISLVLAPRSRGEDHRPAENSEEFGPAPETHQHTVLCKSLTTVKKTV